MLAVVRRAVSAQQLCRLFVHSLFHLELFHFVLFSFLERLPYAFFCCFCNLAFCVIAPFSPTVLCIDVDA